jgi:thymidine phosphorylase
VTRLDAELVGRAAVALGAGRDRADAAVDPAAGIDIVAAVGATVSAGAPVFQLACTEVARLDAARSLLDEAMSVGPTAPPPHALVLEIIDARAAVGDAGRRSP